MFNIILAAGLSSRMKKNKLLLKYEGKTFLHHLIEASFGAQLDVIVVTGCYKDDVINEINFLEKKYKKQIHKVHNPNYENGQLSSLVTGVQNLKDLGNIEPYFISVADVPLLKKDDFISLIPYLKDHDALRPKVNGIFGHPVLINNKITEEIIKLDYKNKQEGLRSFLKKKDTYTFLSNNKAYIEDIDTQEAYLTLISNPLS